MFEDPQLRRERPEHGDSDARRRGLEDDRPGLGWTNPYDPRVWDYNVDIAEAAARAGFDEIMFDYVRFPTDGVVAGGLPRSRSSAEVAGDRRFVEYATDSA